MPVVSRHLLIHGRVQGVYYRASMVREANRLGLSGWVRNRRDGSVEAVAAGDADAIQALVAWARRGPEHARVDKVDLTDGPAAAELPAGFAQRDTA